MNSNISGEENTRAGLKVYPFLNERELPQSVKPLLAPAILEWSKLNALTLEPREKLLGDWFCAGDYGIVFGKRGLGKSWFSLALAAALSQGRDFGTWKCTQPRRVLYVDGEMSLDDFRARVRTLSGGCENFHTLSHQTVFDVSRAGICLSDPPQQAEVTRICEEKKIDVLILDNGACLFRGVAENDADDFRDFVEGWLLDLRRRGIAVVLVLHAGRNGAIRGTSKREDAAFWIQSLDEVAGGKDDSAGARFITRFTKNRNAAEDPPPMEWHFKPFGNETRIMHKAADSMVIFRKWIEDGLETCREIADEMGLSNGQVSKLARRAIDAGWLKKNGRSYTIIT